MATLVMPLVLAGNTAADLFGGKGGGRDKGRAKVIEDITMTRVIHMENTAADFGLVGCKGPFQWFV